jgi:hypothetical protein
MRSPEQDREEDAIASARWRQAALTVPMLALSAGLGVPLADPAAIPQAAGAAVSLLRAWTTNDRRVNGGRTDGR